MINPAVQNLTQGKYNRYEIATATAKCARMITNDYTRQRLEMQYNQMLERDGDRPSTPIADPQSREKFEEMRDEKAVKLAIDRISQGDYVIIHKDPDLQEREEKIAMEGLYIPYERDFFRDRGVSRSGGRGREETAPEDEEPDEDETDEDEADGTDESDGDETDGTDGDESDGDETDGAEAADPTEPEGKGDGD